jgi:hypothetical protein
MDIFGDLMRGKGYLDFNVSGGCGLGLSMGMQFNAKEAHFYFGGGGVTPGVGACLTWSPCSITQGWNYGVQGQAGAAFEIGKAGKDRYFGLGAGVPFGASATGVFVFGQADITPGLKLIESQPDIRAANMF